MTNRFPKYVAWSLLLLIVIATVSPIGLRPHTLTTVSIDRAGAFAVCAPHSYLLSPTLAAGDRCRHRCRFGIEALQYLSPTRHPHLTDAAVKAAGATPVERRMFSYLFFRRSVGGRLTLLVHYSAPIRRCFSQAETAMG